MALTFALPIAKRSFFQIKRKGIKLKKSVVNTLPPYKAFRFIGTQRTTQGKQIINAEVLKSYLQ